jgi:hypothetical protein
MSCTARFEPLPDLARLESRWRALESTSDASFFLGWTWIGSWLASTGARPDMLTIEQDGKDIALALVGHSIDRRALGGVPTLWLNQAGDVEADRPFIEYNGLLVNSSHSSAANNAAIGAIMARGDWKALRLSGVMPPPSLKRDAGFRRWTCRDTSPVCFIDLDAVRTANGDYLSLLSANSRNQIRRSYKELAGPVTVNAARDAAQIEEWLEAMRQLNAGRHADNAWDSKNFRDFARTICVNGLANDETELLEVRGGEAVIGYLLNFKYRGRAMNYQSAFAAPIGPKSKPGLICHAAAVAHYAAQPFSVYSLLAGKDRYKQSLSTGAEQMEWWTGERFAWRLEAEALIRKILKR